MIVVSPVFVMVDEAKTANASHESHSGVGFGVGFGVGAGVGAGVGFGVGLGARVGSEVGAQQICISM